MRTVSGAVHGSRVIETGQKTSSLGASMTSSKSGNGEKENCIMSLYCDNIIAGNLKIETLAPILVWPLSDSLSAGRFKTGQI